MIHAPINYAVDILEPSEALVTMISRCVYYFLDYTDEELKDLMTSYINKQIRKTLEAQPTIAKSHYLLYIDKTNLINKAIEHYRLEHLDELL